MTDGEDRLGSFDEPLAEDSQHRPGEVPEARAPEVEAPRAEVPSPEMPGTDVPSANVERLESHYTNADPEFKVLFWKLVLLYKFGLVGLTLGVLIVAFDAHPSAGPALALGGLGLLVYALFLTRKGKSRLDDGEFDFEIEEHEVENEESSENTDAVSESDGVSESDAVSETGESPGSKRNSNPEEERQ